MPVIGKRRRATGWFRYSALPKKLTGRSKLYITNSESMNARWLAAKTTAQGEIPSGPSEAPANAATAAMDAAMDEVADTEASLAEALADMMMESAEQEVSPLDVGDDIVDDI